MPYWLQDPLSLENEQTLILTVLSGSGRLFLQRACVLETSLGRHRGLAGVLFNLPPVVLIVKFADG